ncbi:MAG: biosynthetic peptidoglycan transglycosylase, partial [Eubacteriales bacterium]|nr:biosynthetic peptidoglycan transglycosylase [Eubacteriales bacterium]
MKAIGILLAAVLAGCIGVTGYALLLMRKRPPLSLYESRRAQPDFQPLAGIPPLQIKLILRQEDTAFYTHRGYNMDNIRRACEKNLRARRIVRGGSTITQQLAKNLYLRFTKTFLRKAVELVIALALERELGKERILELYLNTVYYG